MKGGESATCRPACPGTAAVHGGREGSSGTTAVGTACPERDSPRGSGTEPRGGRGTLPPPGCSEQRPRIASEVPAKVKSLSLHPHTAKRQGKAPEDSGQSARRPVKEWQRPSFSPEQGERTGFTLFQMLCSLTDVALKLKEKSIHAKTDRKDAIRR